MQAENDVKLCVEFDDEQIHRFLDIMHANNLLQGRKKGKEREGLLYKQED